MPDRNRLDLTHRFAYKELLCLPFMCLRLSLFRALGVYAYAVRIPVVHHHVFCHARRLRYSLRCCPARRELRAFVEQGLMARFFAQLVFGEGTPLSLGTVFFEEAGS
jgi:hypothetical protein